MKLTLILALTLALLLAPQVAAQFANEITITGTSFQVNGKPFMWTGISFFNAIYNPSFNKSSAERVQWMQKFQRYGINVLRIWGQWDSKRGYVDTCESCTLYFPDGRLREPQVVQLKAILADADKQGMVVELALFALESWGDNIRLSPEASDKAVVALTKELQPYRNLTLQIWNEFNERVPESVKIIKAIDPKRLVSNSPSVHFVPTITSSFGEDAHNKILDYLTPHTLRQGSGGYKHWEIAPLEEIVKQEVVGLRDIVDIRKALEIWAVRKAAEAPTADLLKELKHCLRTMKLNIGLRSDEQFARFSQADQHFHEVIAEMTGNPVYVHLFHYFTMLLSRSMSITRELMQEPFAAHNLKVHENILRALTAGDPDAAERTMQEHFQFVEELIAPKPQPGNARR